MYLLAILGLEQAILSPGQNSGNYFAPIPLEDHAENKVDILEMLQKAKVDLKPLLSSLSANKEKLKESCKCLLESALGIWKSMDIRQLVLTYCCFIKSQIVGSI